MKKYMLMVSVLIAMVACQESLEQKAAKEASTYTRKSCPVVLNENVVMDSMTFDKDTHTFGYHYRLTGVMDNDSMINAEEMRQKLLAGVKNMTTARVYMEKGYNFQYVYRSDNDPKKILLDVLFTEKDYKQ